MPHSYQPKARNTGGRLWGTVPYSCQPKARTTATRQGLHDRIRELLPRHGPYLACGRGRPRGRRLRFPCPRAATKVPRHGVSTVPWFATCNALQVGTSAVSPACRSPGGEPPEQRRHDAPADVAFAAVVSPQRPRLEISYIHAGARAAAPPHVGVHYAA